MEVTRYLPLVGRILIGLPLLVSGLGKLAAFGPTTAYISSVGLPLAPLGWAIAVVFEVGGGLLMILGFRVREVASGLAVFTLAAATFFHNDFADRNQMIHFLTKIAHFGAGRYSLDARRSRDRKNVAGATA
jgi:putative oxidoreductase